MIPSVEQIEKWAEQTGDGWVRISATCWPELLWCLTEAERAEDVLHAVERFMESKGRVVTTAHGSAFHNLMEAWVKYTRGRAGGREGEQ